MCYDTQKGTGSKAGIGSGTVLFRFCINRHLSKKVYKNNNYRHSHTFKYLKNKKKYMCVLAFFYFFNYFCV